MTENQNVTPIDTPGDYAQALLDRLGSRDPMEMLASTSTSVREAFDGMPESEYRRPEKPAKWSMIEVAHHLADGEMVVGVRIRMILAHDRPEIPAYDQDLWANRLGYRAAALGDVLDQFDVLRAANLRIARGLTSADLARYGVHSERGAESIGYTLRMLAGHDLTHLAQLSRIKRIAHQSS
jgi:hypothetical protein